MKTLFIAITFTALVSCGANPFKAYEKKDAAEDATIALENNDAQKAIDILTTALEDDPSNTTYISILALAYAQRAGVDPLTLAQKMGGASSSTATSASSGNGLTSLFSIMPDATDANISDIDTAVSLLLSIPTASRINADTLKLAMFQIADMTLRSKQLDTNGDGTLSTDELLHMSASSAKAILSQLAAAATAYAGGTSASTTDAAAAAQISKIQAAIQAESGTTDTEKLQSYLGKSSS